MVAQKGNDLLLKIDSDGLGTFTTVAGLRSRTLAFNAESVDITHSESVGQWRELLTGAGVRSARLSGSGIWRTDPGLCVKRRASRFGISQELVVKTQA